MPERIVDLRSDTVTKPTEEMLEAMRCAPVGDDVYGEDPTVKALEELAASRMGMEAGMFVPSGTMGNTCALLAHTHSGEEMVVEELAHIYNWEAGAYANLAGLTVRPVRGEHGVFTPAQLEAALRPDNPHFPRQTLLCLENTHNNAAGAVWTPAQMEAVAAAARARGLAVHLDGARIFNAAVALGVEAREFARHVDSVMFCVSKGLSGPVGSLLCGSKEFIGRAYRERKRLGGAMRQAGVIAAAGIVAIEKMTARLAEDHANARRLCEGLARIPGFAVRQAPLPTNILMVDVAGLGWTSEELLSRWKAAGVLCNRRPPTGARLVTHRHVSAADVDYALEITRRMVEEKKG
ncbi:MAG: aminotransferase class I/II-fold pyridoxal phosphate-dependent enzyme [Candidatus Handelsmanbacteria bacterium]|nr:aminotransferase class I/II-fold pyridoxal phosphate-dependent enzyme [Candidatus Handelsmanbacteria bacterium]